MIDNQLKNIQSRYGKLVSKIKIDKGHQHKADRVTSILFNEDIELQALCDSPNFAE